MNDSDGETDTSEDDFYGCKSSIVVEEDESVEEIESTNGQENDENQHVQYCIPEEAEPFGE